MARSDVDRILKDLVRNDYALFIRLLFGYYALFRRVYVLQTPGNSTKIRKSSCESQKPDTLGSCNHFQHQKSSCGSELPFQDRNDILMTNFAVWIHTNVPQFRRLSKSVLKINKKIFGEVTLVKVPKSGKLSNSDQ